MDRIVFKWNSHRVETSNESEVNTRKKWLENSFNIYAEKKDDEVEEKSIWKHILFASDERQKHRER